jgi:hypothetical protein
MSTRNPRPIDSPDATARSVAHFGTWASLLTALTTLITFAMAIATPPLSGPLCAGECLRYPYTDIASRFPRDYYWMPAAIVATLLYVAFVVALVARAAPHRRLFPVFGLALATMAALTLVGDYFLQLAVVQPSVLAGEPDGVALLTQYNPHGLFIALEEMGYLLMSLSLACMAPALASPTRLERSLRRLFVSGLAVNLALLGWFVARYGHERAYLFEIAVISVDWLVLIAGAFMAAVLFRRDARRAYPTTSDA